MRQMRIDEIGTMLGERASSSFTQMLRMAKMAVLPVWRSAVSAVAVFCAAMCTSQSFAETLSGGAITTRVPLRNAPAAFAEKGAGTIAFLGGSITEMNGFRPLVETILTNRFPTVDLSFTRAGLSSTCSTAGAFRFGDDVLAHGVPDALFVEFAVNDHENPDHPYDVCLRGMEGIVRQARRANPKMDIVMVLFMTEERRIWRRWCLSRRRRNGT